MQKEKIRVKIFLIRYSKEKEKPLFVNTSDIICLSELEKYRNENKKDGYFSDLYFTTKIEK